MAKAHRPGTGGILKSWHRLIFLFLLIPYQYTGAAEIPGAIQPGQIEKQLSRPPSPRATPPDIPRPAVQAAPHPEGPAASFHLSDVSIEGVTAYSPDIPKGYFSALIGKTVTLAQLRTAAENLTSHYRNDGYVLAQTLIPTQTLKEGVVTIKVVEGFIDSVKFDGDQPNDSRGLVLAYAEKIRAARPLRQSVLERYLLLMNDLPGLAASASITPSATQTGAAGLLITLSRKRFGAQAGFNNRLPKLLGTYRGEVYVEENNVLGWQEKAYARLFQSFEGKMTLLSLGQDIDVGTEGTKFSAVVNQVWSQSSIFDVSNGLRSNLISFNLAVVHPLIRTRNSNLSLRGSFSGVDSQSDETLSGTTLIDDRIRSFRVGLTYDLADSFFGINVADIELSQGAPIFGARDPSESSRNDGTAKLSTAHGQVDYTKANLYLSRLQSLTQHLSLLAAFNGQYTEDVLLSPEQFAIGGEQFLRAYDPSEFIGDKGWAAKGELRYAIDAWAPVNTLLYGFYEYGEVFFNDRRQAKISAAAAGAGIRLSFNPYFSGYIEGAKPLHPTEASEGNRDMRLFGGFRLTY
ncbi:ShlB/FhaC/HecB family hemolysin secretion/activation protein [Methylococcus sp. EFPC2]|uniref:ShlB/FhaC/HecB family hemolysin secretion/activation protein n=1 Tax=Methylococcus sp. EFPC2 TaxID=2812648 RepID=UPI0019677328|nr:ShlB/FhaC/HecB family hemolysin secretion/activation protein [Methylococcus sp. EFPC2]QSA97992.1 ShlB/FhaC/HecB family hemolysin secretion/activation protein [Methylococcus sp. EFPC2]